MSKRKARTIEGVEIQESGGNVYADLGYPDAEEMLVKARLVWKISEIVRNKGLTQVEIAKLLESTVAAVPRKGASQRACATASAARCCLSR